MKRLKSFLFFALTLTAVSFGKVSAQQIFKTTAASTIAYYEYLPADYNANSNKYPIVIFLHGIGERGPNTTDIQVLKDNIYKVAKLGPPLHVKNGTKFPFILISPQLKNNYGTWPSGYVMEVLNYVKTYLRVDEKKIYITGLSLGGGGTWVTIQDYPELFAAALPVCGGYNSTSKAYKIAGENLPVWASHGSIDDVVPMSRTVNMVNAINASTPKPSPLAKLTIYTGVKHNAWSYAYRTDHSLHTPNVYEWLMSFTNSTNKGNKIPIASAGVDQTKYLSQTTTSSISGSATDTDGTISTYEWTKQSGPSATLSGTATKTLKVSSLKKGVYVFRLKVKDNSGNSDSDYVKIFVKD
ncbi:MAG TPA: prolyl oligopeptidase family serine peptidase [Chryseosolibacter sp.]